MRAPGRPSMVLLAISLVLGTSSARAYEADLIPTRKAVEPDDFAGAISIGGADGTIRVQVEGVNDLHQEPVDGRATLHLRMRVNGARRRLNLPIPLDGGDGEASASLGLGPDARIVVQQARLRSSDGRIIAEAGAITRSETIEPPPPPPPPDECPAALVSCQDDLAECTQDLDECELDL